MIHWMRERLGNDERGFTLIELMVVVLIIAILIAIAIPTFLGARERAQDRAAQSDLRNGLTAEKVYYTDAEAYTEDTSATSGLASIEPSLTWAVGTNTSVDGGTVGTVYVQTTTSTEQIVCLYSQSASGTNFGIGDIATGGGAGTYYVSAADGSNPDACPTDASAAPGGNWVSGGW